MIDVKVGDIWAQGDKFFRVKSVNLWLDKKAATLDSVEFRGDQYNSLYDPPRTKTRYHFFTTIQQTMSFVERDARYFLNYRCPKTCFCTRV